MKCLYAALFAAATLATGAQASTTATASLSNVHVQVIDLNLEDGIAAGITFTSGTASLELFAGGASPQTLLGSDSLGNAVGPLTAASAYAQAGGAIGAGDLLLGPGISSNTFASGCAALLAESRALAISGFYFTLTANTSLVITGTVDIVSSSADTMDDFALGMAGMGLRMGGADTGPEGFALSYTVGAVFGDVIAIDSTGLWPPPSFEISGATGSGPLMVIYENTSDTAIDGYGWFYTLATTTIPVMAVPEPSTYLLTLAGLCVIGFMTRGRRRAGSESRAQR
jgi:hypothetical protein